MDILLACKFFSRKSKSRVSVTKFSKQLDSRIRVFYWNVYFEDHTVMKKRKWQVENFQNVMISQICVID